jgi:hypothetical protein
LTQPSSSSSSSLLPVGLLALGLALFAPAARAQTCFELMDDALEVAPCLVCPCTLVPMVLCASLVGFVTQAAPAARVEDVVAVPPRRTRRRVVAMAY